MIEGLYRIGVKIFGVVLNNVSVGSHDYYYYYQRYYHQSYYSKDVESEKADSVASS